MKYFKILILPFIIIMTENIYTQDNIINEIAKGGKFIVRDEDQNEAMVIDDGNVEFSGTLKLGVLPEGDISNSIVVWDSVDNLLKLRDINLGNTLTIGKKDECWHTLGKNGLVEDNTTNIRASVQGTATVAWNIFNTDYGHIRLGPANQYNWAHIYTDQPRFIFNKPVYSLTGSFSAYSSYNLSLETRGNPRLTILASNGNVGIGTTSPTSKLEVAGQVKITGGIPGIGKVLTSDSAGLATWETPVVSSGGSTLWTESGSNIYRTEGNIGIGTTSPSSILDVNGTTSAKHYISKGLYEITNNIWDLSQGNLAQVTFSSSITPITISSDGNAGTYVLIVKKNISCTDCNIVFLGATVKYPSGVNPTLSSGANTTDIFSFISVGNNTFYCLYAKNLL